MEIRGFSGVGSGGSRSMAQGSAIQGFGGGWATGPGARPGRAVAVELLRGEMLPESGGPHGGPPGAHEGSLLQPRAAWQPGASAHDSDHGGHGGPRSRRGAAGGDGRLRPAGLPEQAAGPHPRAGDPSRPAARGRGDGGRLRGTQVGTQVRTQVGTRVGTQVGTQAARTQASEKA